MKMIKIIFNYYKCMTPYLHTLKDIYFTCNVKS